MNGGSDELLPVPDSPVISTPESLGATRAMSSATRRIGILEPTSGPPSPSSSRSVLAAARAWRSSKAAEMASSTDSGDNGFSRKLNAPSFVARTASLSPARPLIMMTGRSASLSRSWASVARPSSGPGILRSSSTTSGAASFATATAATPLGASRTSCPSATSSAPTMRRIFCSSSTIRTDAIKTSLRRRGVLGRPTSGLSVTRCALWRHR